MFILLGLLPLFSYLVGAIPTGYWFCKIFFDIDVMQHGSGNIGATNVARTLGSIKYFILIFLIDAIKAFIALFLIGMILLRYSLSDNVLQYILLLSAFALILGNSHSIFLKFKGGKGVATMLGIAAYLINFQLLLFYVSSWLLIVAITRQVFLASLGATFFVTAVYGWLYSNNVFFYFLVCACVWLVVRHKRNIEHFFNL